MVLSVGVLKLGAFGYLDILCSSLHGTHFFLREKRSSQRLRTIVLEPDLQCGLSGIDFSVYAKRQYPLSIPQTLISLSPLLCDQVKFGGALFSFYVSVVIYCQLEFCFSC